MTEDLFAARAEAAGLEQIRSELVARGSAHHDASDSPLTVQRWRTLARRIGHDLGRPIETVANGSEAWAVLRDFPRDDAERVIHDEALRAAMRGARLHRHDDNA